MEQDRSTSAFAQSQPSTGSAASLPSPEEGVAVRSRPPIFFFWPTLVAALFFTALAGLVETKVEVASPTPSAPVAQADDSGKGDATADTGTGADAGQANRATERSWWQRIRLPRPISLGLVLIFTILMVAYFVAHPVFFVWSPSRVDALHRFTTRPLLWRFGLMDLIFGLLWVFLVLSPSYGLMAFLAYYAFGLMTDQEMFTRVDRLRRGLLWVIAAILVAFVLEIVRDQSGEGVVWQSERGGMMAAVFFGFWAFNMFVLAFDFNGASLVALVSVLVGGIALIVTADLLFPTLGIGEFFLGLLGGLRNLRINSAFYQAWAIVLSGLIVFSGFVAKADFWQITPTAIVHYQGIIVQRNRHYGTLAHFHYHVEFPDFFESLLGGQAGNIILSLPREERPEVIEHVWYARYYNRQIQHLLAELPTA